jgi:hypothetical protein
MYGVVAKTEIGEKFGDIQSGVLGPQVLAQTGTKATSILSTTHHITFQHGFKERYAQG